VIGVHQSHYNPALEVLSVEQVCWLNGVTLILASGSRLGWSTRLVAREMRAQKGTQTKRRVSAALVALMLRRRHFPDIEWRRVGSYANPETERFAQRSTLGRWSRLRTALIPQQKCQ
jgi:hypothetical protein